MDWDRYWKTESHLEYSLIPHNDIDKCDPSHGKNGRPPVCLKAVLQASVDDTGNSADFLWTAQKESAPSAWTTLTPSSTPRWQTESSVSPSALDKTAIFSQMGWTRKAAPPGPHSA